jgi:alpha-galactosidase
MKAAEDGGLVLESGRIRLRVGPDVSCRVEARTAAGWRSPCPPELPADERRPFHYPVLDGVPVARFRLQPELAERRGCSTAFGEGERFVLKAVDPVSWQAAVDLELSVDFYPGFPTSAVVRSRFSVGAAVSDVHVTGIAANNLALDARLVGGETPFDMWVYNGSAELREHCLQALTPDYAKRNYLGVLESFDGGGHQPGYRHGSQPGFGGGTPVVAAWSRELGVAVGHVEPSFRRCSLPIRVHDGRWVSLGVFEHRRDTCQGSRSFHSLESFVTLYEGDFYASLETYRKLREAMGVAFPESAEAAYEPIWDTWGFREDFSPDAVLATLPHLRDMGIRWVTLDDRWYDATGDWRPREDHFPGGESEFAGFVERLHREGMKVRLWTLPAEVDAAADTGAWLKAHPSALTEVRKHSHHRRARFHEEHPDWVVVDPGGEAELSKRGNCFCCGSLPGVREHFREIARRMFGDWKVDGLKQDAVYICAACYSTGHGHGSPDDASRDYAEILRVIYETALEHNPEAVIVNCPCGTTLTPEWMRWQNQALCPDPWTSWVNRGTLKQLKALFGPRSAVVLDHVELSDEGQDFSLIGVGGVPATRITPTGEEKTFGAAAALGFEERKALWTRWIGLYRERMLSRGEYLNLYDLVYDVPETHVIRKGKSLYYAFYPGQPDGVVADDRELYRLRRSSKRFRGRLELRGLDPGKSYRVYDYENDVALGVVSGAEPFLEARIDHHLLVEVTEAD